MDKRLFRWVAATLLAVLLMPTAAFAESASDKNRYYFDEVKACKHDKGYTQGKSLEESDPHYGWRIGKFVVSGFTSRTQDDTPTFLKNVDDQVTLSFVLEQDIDKLDDDDKFVVWSDENGYDEYFGIPKTNFGRGLLIVRQTDYQNEMHEPTMYTDYLSGVRVGAETTVDLFEEGDYEVALDYETRKPNIIRLPEYHDYRVFFKFKVRNSNTMMFLFDTKTGNELFDRSVTENGFRIDTANSHYLTINVKRSLINETRDGIVEDTRFNKSATDGSTFEEPGIYYITVSNSETEESTTKTIYVGDDELLKAYVATGQGIVEIRSQLDEGATVQEDGSIAPASAEVPDSGHDEEGEPSSDSSQEADSAQAEEQLPATDAPAASSPFGVRPVFIALFAAAIAFVALRSRIGGGK